MVRCGIHVVRCDIHMVRCDIHMVRCSTHMASSEENELRGDRVPDVRMTDHTP